MGKQKGINSKVYTVPSYKKARLQILKTWDGCPECKIGDTTSKILEKEVQDETPTGKKHVQSFIKGLKLKNTILKLEALRKQA
jgi:hypothetical protein